MNIRIGDRDRVLILDREMPKYCNREGKVMGAGWTIKIKTRNTLIFNHRVPFTKPETYTEQLIAFEVNVEGLPNAWFGEENLVAFK